MTELRYYQVDVIEAIRDQVAIGHKAIICVLPTGGGKSVIFSAIAKSRLLRGGRVMAVVHRRELARQAVGHFRRNGIDPIRVFMGGTSLGMIDSPMSVAAVQTISTPRWSDRLPKADLVIWDECHHIVAKTFRSVLDRYPDALHLGFTATPERSDHSPMGDVFSSMVLGPSISELTASGHLVPCDVWGPAEGRAHLTADPVDAYIEHGQGKRCIIFCQNVRHSKDVTARLCGEGVPAEHVDGSMPVRDREQALARFGNGATRVIVNCNLISEGFDVPACKCIIIARGCDSVAMYLQSVGRALRPEPGEPRALLLDLRGATHKHGLPDAEREFSLTGEAISSGNADNIPIVRQCLHCGAYFKPRPTCPQCGATVPPPKDPIIQREALQRISEAHTDDQRRAYYQKLVQQANDKGYERGWVKHRFYARYKQWPRFRDAS